MARIPDVDDLGARPIPRARAPRTVDQSGAIMAQAIEGTAQRLSGIPAQFVADRDAFQTTTARSAFLQSDIAARKALENDLDYATHETRYRESMQKAQDEAVQKIAGRRSRALFEEQAKLDIERGLVPIRENARRREIDVGRAALDTLIEDNRNSGLAANDEPTRTAFIQNTNAGIEEAVRKGYLTAQEGVARRQKATTDYAMGALEIMSPTKRMEALQKPEGTVASYLPADLRARLKEQTQADIDREAAAAQTALVKGAANRVLQAYEQRGPDEGLAALQKATKGMSPDLADDVYAKVQTGLSRRREAQQQASADIISGIYQSLAANTADESTQEQVEALWQLGALTPTERASLAGRVAAARVESAKANASAQLIRDAVAMGTPLDPSSGDVRKALSAAFAQDAQGSPTGSESWQGLATAYAARTKVLPEQALSWTRAALRSPDPKVAGPAAQFVAGVEASAPEAAGQFDQNTKAFAAIVNQMITAGTNPDEAVKTARATVYDINDAILKQRQGQYKEHAKQSLSTLESFIDRDFDTLLSAQPDVAHVRDDVMRLDVDFNSLSSRYFDKTGDIELARDLAWNDLRRVYGPSRVNGVPVMMAMPPERFGVTPEMVREEITSFIAENPQADGSRPEEIVLVPDARTMREVTNALNGQPVRPGYKVVTKTGDIVRDKNGVELRYELPASDLPERLRAAKADAEARTQEAKNLRATMRAEQEEQRRRVRQGLGPGVGR